MRIAAVRVAAAKAIAATLKHQSKAEHGLGLDGSDMDTSRRFIVGRDRGVL